MPVSRYIKYPELYYCKKKIPHECVKLVGWVKIGYIKQWYCIKNGAVYYRHFEIQY